MKTLFVTLLLVVAAIVPVSAQDSAAEKKEKATRTLGVLFFPGFELLDAMGPLEMWGNLKGQIKVVTVSQKKGEVASSQGPKLVADYALSDCPPLDLLLIPGGFGVKHVLGEKDTLAWIRERSATAELTMSVCNGASILAATGLLDGRPATTNKMFWDLAIAPGPKVNWVRQARWIDDGNIVTSSGVSAGMDMTLHVISRLFGEARAERSAQEIEYEWHRDPTWDPFAEMPGLKRKKKP